MGLFASGSGGGNPNFAGGANTAPYGSGLPNSGAYGTDPTVARTNNAQSWGDPTKTTYGSPFYNPYGQVNDGNGNNLPQFGGARGQANVTANHFGALSDAANNRAYLGYDNAAAFQSQKDQQSARNQQQLALQLQQQAAMGQTPSVAQLQMGQGLNASIAAQQAMANSTRGGGGNIALAQRQAATGAQGMQMQNINQTAQLRAQEMQDARNAYMNGANGIRQGDIAAIGANNTVGVDAAKMQLAQQGLNDQTALSWAGLGNQVTNEQLQADVSSLGAETGVGIANGQLGLAQNNADWQHAAQTAGAVAGFAGLLAA